MAFNHLPGVLVNTIDGGLVARRVPTAKSTLIVGTSGLGPTNDPFQVTDRAAAAQVFGFDGSLIQAMEEVAQNCDNIVLFRMGTSPMVLKNVGKETGGSATPGFDITFSTVTATAPADYSIWYKLGVLYVWYKGNLVYSNDGANAVDTGDISFSVVASAIASNTGMQLGSGASGVLSAAITVQAAAALTPGTNEVAAVLVNPVTGVGMTGRQTYVALAKALDLLGVFPVEQVYCPNVIADEPNVAYYVSSDATTAGNNPATNSDALDWLKTSTDSLGNKTYQWASDTVDDQGNTVSAMVAVTAAARLTAGFHEVHPIYALGRFCEAQTETVGNCVALIGTSMPSTGKFDLVSTRNWVGFLPTYSLTVTNQPTAPGKGLLGIGHISGTTAAKLNSLCKDHSTYRVGGLFKTLEDEYDGTVTTDKNGNPVDVGGFVHVEADVAVLSNGFATQYATNLAGYAVGLLSALDEKVNLTNRPVNAIQLWKPSQGQMDSLFQAGINVLRFKGLNVTPAFLHGETIANSASDYQNLMRVRIKGLVISTVRATADPFLGQGTTDGLQLQAMQTALDSKLQTLQKRGYISRYSFVVTTTPVDQRLGHAQIDVNFMPADELIQLTANVGISRQ